MVASDKDFTLCSVAIFRRVHDEFIQKCRENKFLVRDFEYSEEAVQQQQEDMSTADVTEKELWVSANSGAKPYLENTDFLPRLNSFVSREQTSPRPSNFLFI